jgi:ABC-type phosphate/phosphonate transport system substrate-binding protein
MRVPQVIAIKGRDLIYAELLRGERCVAAVMTKEAVDKIDPDRKMVRIIFEDGAAPNVSITASPRVPPAIRARIVAFLKSDEGKKATMALRSRDGLISDFVTANPAEYPESGEMLHRSLGFWFN